MRLSKKLCSAAGMVLLIFAALTGCTKSKSATVAQEPETPEASNAVEEAGDAGDAGDIEISVAFLSGDVKAFNSSGERYIDIGDTLAVGERIITGSDAFVEIEIGDVGVVRINSDTEYLLDIAEESAGNTQTSGALVAGSIISKVRKLSGNDAFEVSVPGAVCAVRGTQFLVDVDTDGTVNVAVNEGGILLVPPSLALAGNHSADVGKFNEIRSIMPVVSSGEEVDFNAETFSELEARLASWIEKGMRDSTKGLITELDLLLKSIQVEMTDINEESDAAIDDSVISLAALSGTQEESREMVTLRFNTDLQEADIFINGQKAGRQSVSSAFPVGEILEVKAIAADGRVKTRRVRAGTPLVVDLLFNDNTDEALNKPDILPSSSREKPGDSSTITVTIDVEPANATIWIGGKQRGRGRTEITGKPGDHLDLSISAPGYSMLMDEEIIIVPDVSVVKFKLNKHTIVGKVALRSPGVGTPASDGDNAVMITRNGYLYTLQRDGVFDWVKGTGNDGLEYASLSIIDGKVYSIGNEAFTVHDMRDGKILKQTALSANQRNQFGRRVVKVGRMTILPGNDTLEVFDAAGDSVKTVNIPGGSRSTPAVWNNKVLLPNNDGYLLIFNSMSYAVESRIETGVTQPTGLSPAIVGDVAFLAGVNGQISAVDLNKSSIVWTRSLAKGEVIPVYTDFAAANDTVYVYGKERVFALSVHDGQERFLSIEGISAPPMVDGDFLYLCRNDGTLGVYNRRNGRELGKISLGEESDTRPAKLGNYILVAGVESAVVVDARSITEG